MTFVGCGPVNLLESSGDVSWRLATEYEGLSRPKLKPCTGMPWSTWLYGGHLLTVRFSFELTFRDTKPLGSLQVLRACWLPAVAWPGACGPCAQGHASQLLVMTGGLQSLIPRNVGHQVGWHWTAVCSVLASGKPCVRLVPEYSTGVSYHLGATGFAQVLLSTAKTSGRWTDGEPTCHTIHVTVLDGLIPQSPGWSAARNQGEATTDGHFIRRQSHAQSISVLRQADKDDAPRHSTPQCPRKPAIKGWQGPEGLAWGTCYLGAGLCAGQAAGQQPGSLPAFWDWHDLEGERGGDGSAEAGWDQVWPSPCCAQGHAGHGYQTCRTRAQAAWCSSKKAERNSNPANKQPAEGARVATRFAAAGVTQPALLCPQVRECRSWEHAGAPGPEMLRAIGIRFKGSGLRVQVLGFRVTRAQGGCTGRAQQQRTAQSTLGGACRFAALRALIHEQSAAHKASMLAASGSIPGMLPGIL